jgi:hypothetical protein
MWAVNTLFAAPDDAEKIRVRVRACGDCAKDLIQAQRDMEWDNASMTSV